MARKRIKAFFVISFLITISINLVSSPFSYAQEPGEGEPVTRPGKILPSTESVAKFDFTGTAVDSAALLPIVPESGPITAVILMEGDPAAAASAVYDNSASTEAYSAAMNQASVLRASQMNLSATLSANLNIQTVGHLVYLTNGLVVNMDASQIDAVKALPGVKDVIPDQLLQLDTSQSVPFIGAPAAWQLGTGITGEGMRIGIIDSGIDYTHANFGGSGSVAVYTGNNTADISDIGFDGSKVVGGYDFVGDGWTSGTLLGAGGSPLGSSWVFEVGDNDPIDCAANGHGSHVAGIAAGYGVDSAGNTYTGSYPPADFSSMMIGPGVAPKAQLYALKIGDCTTSVSFDAALLALDFVMDPNGDGNINDHLDVTNSSYGGAYGTPVEVLDQAFNLASANGVIMIGSAGNEGDTYFIHGDPGMAESAISVASSVSDTLYKGLEITTGPAGAFPSYPTVIAANSSSGGALGSFGPYTLQMAGGTINNQGCSVADYASFSGQAALIIWDDTASGCGSGARMTNAVNAGGVTGLVVVSADPADFPFINLACTYSGGPSPIPCVSITATDGALLQADPSAYTVRFDSDLNQALGVTLADKLSSFSSRGPGNDGGTGIITLKPDVSAPGDAIHSTDAGTGNASTLMGGTSMAAPHVTGMATLLRQQHPNWSVAQIKALIMNTATHDLWTGANQTGDNYGVSRVGAGRIDIVNAIGSNVVAYSTRAPQQVSVSFGLVEVVDTVQMRQTITVRNLGKSPQMYNISFQQINDTSGASFSVSPSSVQVPGGATRQITVTLTANKANMIEPHLPDPTTPETQLGAFGNLDRHWISEEGGYVVLEAVTATPDLRVPVHAVVRPASDMAADGPLYAGPAAAGSAALFVEGDEVYTGNNLPYDIISQVTAFELVYEDPVTMPAELSSGDIRYIGVTSDYQTALVACGGNLSCAINNTTIYFGIVAYGNWNQASGFDAWFDIGIDANEDNVYDTHVFNFETGFLVGADWTDTILSWYTDGESWIVGSGNPLGAYYANDYSAGSIDTYVMDNNVIVLPVGAADAGLTSADTTFQFDLLALSYFYYTDFLPDAAPYWISYDIANPAYSFTDLSGLAGGPYWGMPMWSDLDGNYIPVDYDLSAYGSGPYPDILLLHHHNAGDNNRAELVQVVSSNNAEIDVEKTVDNNRPAVGDTITYTITVANNGPVEASELVLEDTLPEGLTYVSDTCPGASTNIAQPDGSTLITCDLTGITLPSDFMLDYEIMATVDAGAVGIYTNRVTLTGWNTLLDIFRPVNQPGADSDAVKICVGTLCERIGEGEGEDEGGEGSGGAAGTGSPDIVVFDPALSKLGTLAAGALGLPGEQLTWTLTISNVGGAPGTDIVVTDNIRPELRVDGADIAEGTAVVAGQQVTFSIPVLNPGESVLAHIYTTVLSGPASGQFENTATVSGTGPDGVVTDSASTKVSAAVALPSTGYPPAEKSDASTLPVWVALLGGLIVIVALGGAFKRSYHRN